MNRKEAIEVLLRYRTGTSDDEDPDVREALEIAAGDPDFSVWLRDQAGFQKNIQAQFRNMKVPAGLREQILSEKPALVPRVRPPVGRLAISGVMALLIVVALAVWLPRSGDTENTFATFRLRMVKASLRGYAMDVETGSEDALRQFLQSREAVSTWPNLSGSGGAPLMGGAVMTWRSRPATMICFGSGQQPELWLFAVDSRFVPDPPDESGVVFRSVGAANTLSWSSEGVTYVLVGQKPENELRRLVGNGA